MKSICCLSLLLSLAGFTRLDSGEIDYGCYFLLGSYDLTIGDDVIENLPRWRPEEGNPPVSPRDAMIAADRAKAEVFDNIKFPGWKTKFAELSLTRLDTDVWMWTVSYDATWKGYNFADDPVRLSILVLMTGEALTPKFVAADSFYSLESLQERAEEELQDLMELFEEPLFHPPGKPTEWKFGGMTNQGWAGATITSEMLSATPDWKPEAKHPPLAIDKAIRTATAVQQKWLHETDRLRVDLREIQLVRLHDDKWVWQFYYDSGPKVGGGTGFWPGLYVTVLMNGETVELEKVGLK